MSLKNIANTTIPGEKYMWYAMWIIAIIISIISNGLSVPFFDEGFTDCVTILTETIIGTVYCIVLLINTTLLLTIVYRFVRHKLELELSYGFYFPAVIAFQYLRLPYYIFTISNDITYIERASNITIYAVLNFISEINGAVMCFMIAYNLDYFTILKEEIKQSIENCKKSKSDSNGINPEI